MTVTASPDLCSLRAVSPANKHCIFRSGETWFSLPATSVREITIAPARVKVPLCHRALVGLSHLRSVFLPIVFLNDLLDLQQGASGEKGSGTFCAKHPEDEFTAAGTSPFFPAPSRCAHQQLLVLQAASPWALLIAEAVGLEFLETLLTPEGSWEESNQSPVTGTAMYRDQIVQVLDPNRLLQFAQQVFDGLWCGCALNQRTHQPALTDER